MSVGKYIIIDEASMIGTRMANLLSDAVDIVDNKTLILCGDWAQAAPVKDEWPIRHDLFKDAEVIFLRESHRQSDVEFLSMLNNIRTGVVTKEAAKFFSSRVIDKQLHDTDTVKMYATNKKVDAYNRKRLEEHARQTGVQVFNVTGSVTDERGDYARKNYPLTPRDEERLLDISPVAHNELLAEGCRVMITYNIPNHDNNSSTYLAVNGDTGILVSTKLGDYTRFLVRLDRTGRNVTVFSVDVESYGYSTTEPDYTIHGIPIRLGYALTVHKSQGMSLHKVEVDTASILHHPEDSRHGLVYVALSRARTPDGLSLLNWHPKAVYSNQGMVRFLEACESKAELTPTPTPKLATTLSVDDLVKWFFNNYADPANGVPYCSREGGYQYVNGGPYEARDVLGAQFPNVDSCIREQAIDQVNQDGLDWVRWDEY